MTCSEGIMTTVLNLESFDRLDMVEKFEVQLSSTQYTDLPDQTKCQCNFFRVRLHKV